MGRFGLAPADLVRMDGMSGKRLTTYGDAPAVKPRRLARREPDRAATAWMQATAGALEGLTRA